MPRGRTIESKAKEAYWVSKRMTLGIAQGDREAHRLKGLDVSTTEHMGKMLDRVDPLEMLALVGLTMLIHDTILGSETLLAKWNANAARIATALPAGVQAMFKDVSGLFK